MSSVAEWDVLGISLLDFYSGEAAETRFASRHSS